VWRVNSFGARSIRGLFDLGGVEGITAFVSGDYKFAVACFHPVKRVGRGRRLFSGGLHFDP
jgi:hypothetical protein